MIGELSLSNLLIIAGFLATTIGNWFVFKNKLEHTEEENRSQWEVITRLRNWQENHVIESAEKRLEIEREMGRIRESASSVLTKLDSLLALVNDLTKKIDRLEAKS